jgi:2-polyprenyl-6-methoxyphenol hydroxylase-like FAD-dependent oxidoreductase
VERTGVTGIDPISGKSVRVARQMRDRKLQRALMQFFKAAKKKERGERGGSPKPSGRLSMRVAINGMGIAGPCLAYWLQRGGHEVVLIEKAPRFRTGGYAIDFWGVGYTVAERMGILPEVHERGYVFRELRIVDARGRTVGGFSTDFLLQGMKGRYTSLPRGDLAAAIYRTIENRVETLFGNSISAIDERATGVLVSFEHGGAREFDLVIGADGLHSTVRDLAFGPEHQFEKQLGYRIAAFEAEGYRPRDELVGVTYSTPGRQVGRFSLRGDRTMFSFLFASEWLNGPEPPDARGRKALLRQVFADAGWECPQILQAMDQASDMYYDRVSQIRMDGWSKGRVILIGDAAACVSLLAGEGAGLAMAEACVLAGELNRAGPDYQAAYRRYERLLRPYVEARQKSARYFASAFVPKTRVGVWLRNQATKLMAFRPLAHFFLGRQLRDDFDLPNYDVPVPGRLESQNESVADRVVSPPPAESPY